MRAMTELLALLAQSGCPVEPLAPGRGLKPSTASVHLQTLTCSGLVRRDGTRTVYRPAARRSARPDAPGSDHESRPGVLPGPRVAAGQAVVNDGRPSREYAAGDIPGDELSIPARRAHRTAGRVACGPDRRLLPRRALRYDAVRLLIAHGHRHRTALPTPPLDPRWPRGGRGRTVAGVTGRWTVRPRLRERRRRR